MTLDGTPPTPTFVIEGGRTQHVLYLDKSGSLQYAVVFLHDFEAAPLRGPRGPQRPLCKAFETGALAHIERASAPACVSHFSGFTPTTMSHNVSPSSAT